MSKIFKIFVLVVYSTIVVSMIGCGENGEDVALVSANPPNNSTIAPDDTITVTFDNTPVNLNVEFPDTNPRLWEIEGRTLILFAKPGWIDDSDLVIIIDWSTGRKILNYTVQSPTPTTSSSGSIYKCFATWWRRTRCEPEYPHQI